MATTKAKTENVQGTREWFCVIDAHSNGACKREHRRRSVGRTNTLPIPNGHDRCGWVTVPQKADKSFQDAPKNWWLKGNE